MNATCYHLRDMAGMKVLGGSLSMATPTDLNTAAARLVAELDVAVLPSGRVSFMRNGKPVWAYLTIDPTDTDKARAALAADRQRRADAQAAHDAQQAELDALIDQHGVAGAIAKLKGA
jgi:response regulator of citrate/malate metabolism